MSVVHLYPKCAHCGRGIHRRALHEELRFCSYQCAVNEQREHVATTMRNTGSGNDPSTH